MTAQAAGPIVSHPALWLGVLAFIAASLLYAVVGALLDRRRRDGMSPLGDALDTLGRSYQRGRWR